MLIHVYFPIVACLVQPVIGQLVSPLYSRLPVGSIKPSGWAHDQAQIQADGLMGHIREFGSYVAGSIWVKGGSIEYSEMHESAPYWFNSAVALAFQLQDQRLIAEVRDFLDWNLDNQQQDGWIGPEILVANSTQPRLTWPRYLVLLGLTQYAEADPTQTDRIVDAIHRFLDLVYTIWKNGDEGGEDLGFQFGYQYVRWEELIDSLEWVYDNYPRGKEAQLLETMQLVRDSGFSWKNDWYTEANFPKTAVTQGFSQQTHGVNNALALKAEALAYRFTADDTDKKSTFDRVNMTYTYHGRASGTFSADEHLAGLNPSRGTELCTVVEQIYSLAIIYQILGNNDIADRVERIAYNALPAGIMHDWWSHQYDQQVNQIWSQSLNPPPWGNNGPLSNVFGFEPNYPCCTVNHGQAYPKFWSNSVVIDRSGSLVHVFLGPLTYKGIIGDNSVSVTVNTLYPFGSTLAYTVTASKSLTFKIRIPQWAQTSGTSTIRHGRAQMEKLSVDDASMQSVKIAAGKPTVFSISLNAPLVVETRTPAYALICMILKRRF